MNKVFAILSVWVALVSVNASGAVVDPLTALTWTVSGGEVTVTDCDTAAAGSLNIPATLDGKPVSYIAIYAFQYCTSLTSVTIPSSVTSIEDSTFYQCSSLTSVTIPSSVTSIGPGAFSGCSSLTSVTIPAGVTSIEDRTFRDCTSLTSVTIPEGVTSIGDYAFAYCSSLTSVTIPEGVTSIGLAAFNGCISLTSVTIPSSVTTIGNYAFALCEDLTSVTIPSSVTSIGDYAFYNCTGLTSVTIPEGVTSIGEGAFYNCTNLTSIAFSGSAPASVGVAALTGLATGAKALVYASYQASFGAGATWNGLVVEVRPDPVASVRFISPANNAKVYRTLVTRYGVTNPEWASKMEVQVRGRGKTVWLSYDEVADEHTLTRKIFNPSGSRFVKTVEYARVRNLSGNIVQVASRNFQSKFPWNNRRSKINVLQKL